ncbi:ATP-binding cassette domain-containing protein [Poseidonibacter lekithochrous]|uniref:ATP-binding cassette domain-containing protein n=1 Tax=Poseidonibacter lekithochrous TaxID=1904463 RepID=UPI0008FC6F73|nr:ATP-binding cassette domain-containing protein [Poseidonibacter lekithochrous]QKJ22093.1 ABC transporter, ATP-binding protein [Poseidonibacter lekithochrous]
MNNETVLEVNDLTFYYKENFPIYKNFSMELKRGELFTIFGKSGSGKTTLFELITGTIKPQKGTIRKENLSLIFQDPYNSFHPTYTIIEQIKDVVFYDFKEDMNAFLQELSLDAKLIEKRPHELSGGQLQRCSILRALLMKPKLLLVDEPTSALDNVIAYDVMKLLIKYLDSCAILLITHDMDLATWCSDKIIRLEEDARK